MVAKDLYHESIKNALIKDGWTIVADLLREGIPKEDIVLAFHDPETRKLTDFAVA